jgi:hypothetical protein
MSDASGAEGLRKRLETDAAAKVFLVPEFDVAAFASQIVAHESKAASEGENGDSNAPQSAEAVVQMLGERIDEIEKVVKVHVSEHHDELLSRVGTVRELSENTETVHCDVTSLKASIERIKKDMIEPLDEMKRNTVQLHRIHQTSDMLR